MTARAPEAVAYDKPAASLTAFLTIKISIFIIGSMSFIKMTYTFTGHQMVGSSLTSRLRLVPTLSTLSCLLNAIA